MMDMMPAARDVYLRYDGGPVQCLRAWDAPKLIESQVHQGLDAKDKNGEPAPVLVSIATREQYLAEHRRK